MTEDYTFILKRTNGKKIVFGRSKLVRFADNLPKSEVHIVDNATCRSLGYMSILRAKQKFT